MSDVFGPTALAVTQGIGAFNVFLPNFSEIRRSDPVNNPDVAADVRMGEIAACTLTLGVGIIATSLTGSRMPLMVSAITCVVLIGLYETTLRVDRPMEPK